VSSHDVHVAGDEQNEEPFAPRETADTIYATSSRIRSELTGIQGENKNSEGSVNPNYSALCKVIVSEDST